VPLVCGVQLHGLQLEGAVTVTPPATVATGFDHAPGQPIDGLVPFSRMIGPLHPAGTAGAHMPAQVPLLVELELEELLAEELLAEELLAEELGPPLVVDELLVEEVEPDKLELELDDAPPIPELDELLGAAPPMPPPELAVAP
jgi:hypothetical protein